MVLIRTADGKRFVFDCNLTSQNEAWTLASVSGFFGKGASIYAFICSHRDADHIRGIRNLNAAHPIQRIWDSGVAGTTTTSTEYLQYMTLRRSVPTKEIKKLTNHDFGSTRFRYLSSKDSRLAKNANAQGIVLMVEQRSGKGGVVSTSVILPGDSDAETWRKAIIPDYRRLDMLSSLSASILMAGHHGSKTFFDDDEYSTTHFYTAHTDLIRPSMCVISVGPNTHGHPSSEAIKLYERCTTGSNKGNKIARTDRRGDISLSLKQGGKWNISYEH